MADALVDAVHGLGKEAPAGAQMVEGRARRGVGLWRMGVRKLV